MHRRLPVTLIGGFLGAGKTSLLHHFVTAYQGGHLALLVGGTGALNPDAKALRGLCGAMGKTYHAVEEISPESETSEALAKKLRELAQAGRYERVLVEVSGTTDTSWWIRHFQASSDDPDSFAAWAELEQVVCVVDLLNFQRVFLAPETASPRGARRDFQRDQIGGAGLLVLNKCDLLGDSERQQSSRLLREMNPTAWIIEAAYGEVQPDLITHRAPGSRLDGVRVPRAAEQPAVPLQNVVYRAHRPFHPGRLWDWFNAPHTGLLRVKGLVWLATRNLLVGGISRTAWQNSCGAAGLWWAALPREEWPADLPALEQMQANWREPYGDRRQELVLIGERDPTVTAARQLDGCLLTAEEYARPLNEWLSLPDPFPAWDLED